MAEEVARLESPIDVMYLIHKALRAEAARSEQLVSGLDTGDSLQRFRLAFNSWATALVYHAELEDRYIMGPLTNSHAPELAERLRTAMAGMEDEMHRELVQTVQDVLTVLNEEIGKTSLITRTKQHLYRQVVALRIAQEDHLENEEALVLPLVRERMDQREQLTAAKSLLIDEEAENCRWIIEWVAEHLNPREQKLLADLEAHFHQVPAREKEV